MVKQTKATMKKLSVGLLAALFSVMFVATSCHKGPTCPAYNTTHNSKDYANNPNNTTRSEENNKADIEKRREAELNGSKTKKRKSYGLFPKWMGIKSR